MYAVVPHPLYSTIDSDSESNLIEMTNKSSSEVQAVSSYVRRLSTTSLSGKFLILRLNSSETEVDSVK